MISAIEKNGVEQVGEGGKECQVIRGESGSAEGGSVILNGVIVEGLADKMTITQKYENSDFYWIFHLDKSFRSPSVTGYKILLV